MECSYDATLPDKGQHVKATSSWVGKPMLCCFCGRAMFRQISSFSFCSQRAAGCLPMKMHTSNCSPTWDGSGTSLSIHRTTSASSSEATVKWDRKNTSPRPRTPTSSKLGPTVHPQMVLRGSGATGIQRPLVISQMGGEIRTLAAPILGSEWMKVIAPKRIGISDIIPMSDAQASEHVFIQYRYYRRRWRRFTGKPVRMFRHGIRRFVRCRFKGRGSYRQHNWNLSSMATAGPTAGPTSPGQEWSSPSRAEAASTSASATARGNLAPNALATTTATQRANRRQCLSHQRASHYTSATTTLPRWRTQRHGDPYTRKLKSYAVAQLLYHADARQGNESETLSNNSSNPVRRAHLHHKDYSRPASYACKKAAVITGPQPNIKVRPRAIAAPTQTTAAAQLFREEPRRTSAEYSLWRLTAVGATQDLFWRAVHSRLQTSTYTWASLSSNSPRWNSGVKQSTLVYGSFRDEDGLFTDQLMAATSIQQEQHVHQQQHDAHSERQSGPITNGAFAVAVYIESAPSAHNIVVEPGLTSDMAVFIWNCSFRDKTWCALFYGIIQWLIIERGRYSFYCLTKVISCDDIWFDL